MINKQIIWRPVLIHNASGMYCIPLRYVKVTMFEEVKELLECAMVGSNSKQIGAEYRIGTKPDQVKLFFHSQLTFYSRRKHMCTVYNYHVPLDTEMILNEEKFAGQA